MNKLQNIIIDLEDLFNQCIDELEIWTENLDAEATESNNV